MKPLLFIAAFSLLSLSAQARLGESPSQIAARYGQPTDTPHIIGTNEYLLHYKHGDYDIAVTFWNAKDSEEIVYAKAVLDDDVAKALFTTIAGVENAQVDTKDGVTTFTESGVIGYFRSGPQLDPYMSTVSVSTYAYDQHYMAALEANLKKSAEAAADAAKKKATEGF